MPKKRAAAKSRKDEQTKDVDSGSIFQKDDDAKRLKLEPVKVTTLQDLPIETLEFILLKAVTMELLELARCAREEQADLVIRRLGTVCSQWNSVLTTDIFRKEVHRLLEGPDTIRFEILDQPTFQANVLKLTTLKDEIFLLCRRADPFPMAINVYDRNNMAEVKDVIPLLARIWPADMASCIVSNCVYVLNRQLYYCPSVFRIKKDEEHHFKLEQWLNNRAESFTSRGPMSVASNGNLVILSTEEAPKSDFYVGPQEPEFSMFKARVACVGIFDAYGSLQHTIMLSPDIYGFRIINSVIQKSDGNLVLLAAMDENRAKLLEIDTMGSILRQYQSSLDAYRGLSLAEVSGRILVTGQNNRIEPIDRLLNPLEIADPLPPEDLSSDIAPQLHFDRERNEMVRIETLDHINCVLSIFRLTRE